MIELPIARTIGESMRQLIATIITMGICLVAGSSFGQEKLEAAQPVMILNPGHDDFVIPPFWVEGRAEPGEKLGLFVNGYPHMMIEADARGRFMERIAWSHDGPVWVEIRRGDSRRHAVKLRVAQVSPAVGNRVLAHAAPSLMEVDRQFEPKLLPVEDDGFAVAGETNQLTQFTRPIRSVSPTQRHLVSITGGLVAQFIGLATMAQFNYSPGDKSSHGASLVLMSMSLQAAMSYVLHTALGGEPNKYGVMVGTILPTAVALLGFATGSDALVAGGVIAQPVGASLGGSF